MKRFVLFFVLFPVVLSAADRPQRTWDPFLDTLQERTLRWFLHVTPEENGLTPDRWPTDWSPASIAAVGFALSTYPVSVERGIITRDEAVRRTLNTLRFFRALPQSADNVNTSGYNGFYYHFLKKQSGLREWNCELSSIDTGLLMCGMLLSAGYFDRSTAEEKEIRAIADSLYRRVNWKWMTDGRKGIVMGWKPTEGFHKWTWFGYTEAMLLYILALGSPTHPVGPEAWTAFNEKYLWANHYGQEHLNFMPLFGHQYSQVWIDFRGIQDPYMKGKGIDYFENSRRATYVHRTYSAQNPNHWIGYSDSVWGMTACDGPKDTIFTVNGIKRDFRSYSARGTGADEHLDDGTIAPTAAGGSIPFAPEICIPALKAMRSVYGNKIWTEYGFIDAFNPTYITPKTPEGWYDTDYLGIDQGPIALMIENYRNGFLWEVMKKNPYIVAGLRRAGFTGGWLAAPTKK